MRSEPSALPWCPMAGPPSPVGPTLPARAASEEQGRDCPDQHLVTSTPLDMLGEPQFFDSNPTLLAQVSAPRHALSNASVSFPGQREAC